MYMCNVNLLEENKMQKKKITFNLHHVSSGLEYRIFSIDRLLELATIHFKIHNVSSSRDTGNSLIS